MDAPSAGISRSPCVESPGARRCAPGAPCGRVLAAAAGVDRALPEARLRSLRVGPLSVGALHRVLHDASNTAAPPAAVAHPRGGRGQSVLRPGDRAGARTRSLPSRAGKPLPVPTNMRDLVAAGSSGLPEPVRHALLIAPRSGADGRRVRAVRGPDAAGVAGGGRRRRRDRRATPVGSASPTAARLRAYSEAAARTERDVTGPAGDDRRARGARATSGARDRRSRGRRRLALEAARERAAARGAGGRRRASGAGAEPHSREPRRGRAAPRDRGRRASPPAGDTERAQALLQQVLDDAPAGATSGPRCSAASGAARMRTRGNREVSLIELRSRRRRARVALRESRSDCSSASAVRRPAPCRPRGEAALALARISATCPHVGCPHARGVARGDAGRGGRPDLIEVPSR